MAHYFIGEFSHINAMKTLKCLIKAYLIGFSASSPHPAIPGKGRQKFSLLPSSVLSVEPLAVATSEMPRNSVEEPACLQRPVADQPILISQAMA